MLGKLIKYEWKNTYKVGLILLAAIAMATLLGFLSLQTPLWRNMAGDRVYYDSLAANMLDVMSIFSIILYVMLLAGVIYTAFIYLVVRFYRTMYTDEGYLLHTLPVSKNQILISKILVSSVWIYLIYLAMFASVAFFILSLVNVFLPDNIWLSLPEYMVRTGELMNELRYELGFNLASWSISLLASSVLGIPASIITFFGAVSMGQLFSKHRVLMAILCYVAIMIGSSIINAILQSINAFASVAPFYQYSGMSLYLLGNMNIRLVTSLIIAAGCYLASYYITSRNLNMD